MPEHLTGLANYKAWVIYIENALKSQGIVRDRFGCCTTTYSFKIPAMGKSITTSSSWLLLQGNEEIAEQLKETTGPTTYANDLNTTTEKTILKHNHPLARKPWTNAVHMKRTFVATIKKYVTEFGSPFAWSIGLDARSLPIAQSFCFYLNLS
ncbi:hypothetical protein BBP40_001231 [Aspergillus hancockii]|nr:hypothetical protein BBP40_001231 [Aspergillus hancockii]